MVDANGTYHRFLAIVVDVQWGHNRTFDAHGTEIETEQATMDRIRTGYAKWELVEKKDPNVSPTLFFFLFGKNPFSPNRFITRKRH